LGICTLRNAAIGTTPPKLAKLLGTDVLAGTEQVQRDIDGICEEVSKAETVLEAAKQAGDDEETKFQRIMLEQLIRDRKVLRKEKNIILRSLPVAG